MEYADTEEADSIIDSHDLPFNIIKHLPHKNDSFPKIEDML